MDSYFLKIKIIEFEYILNQENKDNNIEQNKEENFNPNYNIYEIEFELTKSNEKYILKIINDNNGIIIPFTNYFTIPTSIKIDNNNNDILEIGNYIDKDSLEVSLYINNNEKKLIDIDSDILIDENCKEQPKISELSLGNFHIKFLFKLSRFEDLCLRENDINLMLSTISNENNKINQFEEIDDDNINIDKDNGVEIEEEDLVTKYHNLLGNKKIKVDDEDEVIYDESLFQEIDPIDFENIVEKKSSEKESINITDNDKQCGIYRDIKTNDFFDINVDIFEEEENEDEEDIIEENANAKKDEASNSSNKYNLYKYTHLILYENISLGKPKLKEIIKNNLIDCFLVSGLSKNKKELPNSETYISQCKHKNCQYNKSYASDILFRLQKSNLYNISEIDSLSISNLIFPYGIKICFGHNYLNHIFKKRSSSQFQEAEYSFNILTDIKGKIHYIYSLIFFIQFEFEEFIQYFNEYKSININSSTIVSKQIKNNSIYVPFAFSLISNIFDLENFYKILNDLYTTFFTSQMNIEKFDNELINLIFELPAPPLNSKMKIFLPNSYVEINSNIYENKIYNGLNYYHVLFQKNCYSIGFIIKIFILFLLEKKVLIHSSKENKIYETIEVLLNFIYPIKWVNSYIPLIPDENTNLILQSFLPFIIGMTHQSFFNCANKIEKLNEGNNQDGKYDNIFIINLDTENILPTKKMNELVDMCPIYETIEEKYHKLKNQGELDSDKIRNIFLEGIIDVIGDYERYTSKLGENNLFNQKIFLRNKNKKYLYFYEEITSTQQFYQFINEVNNDDFYFREFKDRIKMNNKKNRTINEDIYLDEYNIYPYFLKQDNKDDIDLFTFEDELELYYNVLNKEHQINYLLDTEAYIRILLILKNYIPHTLKKYSIKKESKKTNKNINEKNELYNIYLSNYDSNISTTDLENDESNNIRNVLGSIYGKMKESIINNIFTDENKENINNNIQKVNDYKKDEIKKDSKIPYRRRDSLIKMIKNNCPKNELLKYKEQIIDLLKDYMGYIFSNEREDIPFTLNELSKLFSYRRIRREFSKILYQKKFDNDIEHELGEETFNLLYQTIFFCLVNLSDNKNEYKVLRRVIKSMFYYFYKDLLEQKIYLYQKINEKNEKFYFLRSSNFWKYFYKIEKLEFPDNDNLTKIKNIMSIINVDSSIINYLD